MTRAEPVGPDELMPLAAHVRWEYDSMRVATTAVLELHGATGSRSMVRDLFVVTLNIKARNLLHFFESPASARPEDVVARLYVDDWSMDDVGVDVTYLRSAFAPGVNKRVLHLTARLVRIDSDEDAMRVAEIYWSLAGMMQRFMDRLATERRSWFCPDGSEPDTSPSALGLQRTDPAGFEETSRGSG